MCVYVYFCPSVCVRMPVCLSIVCSLCVRWLFPTFNIQAGWGGGGVYICIPVQARKPTAAYKKSLHKHNDSSDALMHSLVLLFPIALFSMHATTAQHTHTHTHTHTHAHACSCTYTHVCTHTHTHVYAYTQTYINTQVHTYTYLHCSHQRWYFNSTYLHIPTYIHAQVHTQTHTYAELAPAPVHPTSHLCMCYGHSFILNSTHTHTHTQYAVLAPAPVHPTPHLDSLPAPEPAPAIMQVCGRGEREGGEGGGR